MESEHDSCRDGREQLFLPKSETRQKTTQPIYERQNKHPACISAILKPRFLLNNKFASLGLGIYVSSFDVITISSKPTYWGMVVC